MFVPVDISTPELPIKEYKGNKFIFISKNKILGKPILKRNATYKVLTKEWLHDNTYYVKYRLILKDTPKPEFLFNFDKLSNKLSDKQSNKEVNAQTQKQSKKKVNTKAKKEAIYLNGNVDNAYYSITSYFNKKTKRHKDK